MILKFIGSIKTSIYHSGTIKCYIDSGTLLETFNPSFFFCAPTENSMLGYSHKVMCYFLPCDYLHIYESNFFFTLALRLVVRFFLKFLKNEKCSTSFHHSVFPWEGTPGPLGGKRYYETLSWIWYGWCTPEFSHCGCLNKIKPFNILAQKRKEFMTPLPKALLTVKSVWEK